MRGALHVHGPGRGYEPDTRHEPRTRTDADAHRRVKHETHGRYSQMHTSCLTRGGHTELKRGRDVLLGGRASWLFASNALTASKLDEAAEARGAGGAGSSELQTRWGCLDRLETRLARAPWFVACKLLNGWKSSRVPDCEVAPRGAATQCHGGGTGICQ